MNDEEWLSRAEALRRLRHFLKLSQGAAEQAFSRARAGGTIRGRDVIPLLSDDGSSAIEIEQRFESNTDWPAHAEVSSEDLEYWVAGELARADGALAQEAATRPRQTAEEAAQHLLPSLLKKGLTKEKVRARLALQIPDLQKNEFDRVWHNTAGDAKKPGRRPSIKPLD